MDLSPTSTSSSNSTQKKPLTDAQYDAKMEQFQKIIDKAFEGLEINRITKLENKV